MSGQILVNGRSEEISRQVPISTINLFNSLPPPSLRLHIQTGEIKKISNVFYI